MKTLLALVAPGAIAIVAAAAVLLLAPGSVVVEQAARGYPLVALAVATLLAWRMHRSRILLAAVLLLAAHAVLDERAFAARTDVHATVAILLPLLIAALAFSADRNIAGRYVAAQTALIGLPIGLAAAFLAFAPEQLVMLNREFIDSIYTSWAHMPQLALSATIIGLGALTALALYRGRSTDAGLAWAALAGVIAVAAPAGTPRGIWMLAAGLVLVMSLIEHAYVMAYHDELTGLPARRSLAQTLAALRPPYTVAIVDVDHFKQFNDRYGHDVGDEVLRMVATRLAAVTGGGRAYRSGGEEFTIVFPGRAKAEALPHVEQVREAVAASTFTVRKLPRPKKADGERKRGARKAAERRIGVTISIGLAGVDRKHTTTEAVVQAADKAMYRAKQGGRNRVVA